MAIKQLAIRSVFSNWTGRACSIVITFFLTPFVVNSLGGEAYGLWAILMSFTSYYALADMGVRAAAVKYMSQYIGAGDREATSRMVVTTLVVYLTIAACLALLVVLLTIFFPFAIEIAPESLPIVRLVILLTGLAVSFKFFGEVFAATLHSYQRFDLSNVVSISSQLVKAIAFVIVLRRGAGLVGMAAATLVVTVCAQMCLALIATRLLGGISLSWKRFDREMLRQVFGFAGTSFVTTTARRLTQYFGVIIIGITCGPAAAAFYAIPESLSRHAQSFAKGVTSVIDPLASRLDSQGNKKSLLRLLVFAPRFLLAYSLSIAVLFITHGQSFISFWIAPEYGEKAYPVLCILMFALVFRVTSDPLRSLLRGMGHLKILAVSAALEMAITLIVGPCLAYQFGLTGMAWAILIAQFSIGAIILPQYCCRILDFSMKAFVQQVVVPPLGVAATSLAVAIPLAVFIPASSLFTQIVEMGLIALVAAGATFFLCLGRAEILSVLEAISGRSKRKNLEPG